jgi:hypothetical protein
MPMNHLSVIWNWSSNNNYGSNWCFCFNFRWTIWYIYRVTMSCCIYMLIINFGLLWIQSTITTVWIFWITTTAWIYWLIASSGTSRSKVLITETASLFMEYEDGHTQLTYLNPTMVEALGIELLFYYYYYLNKSLNQLSKY